MDTIKDTRAVHRVTSPEAYTKKHAREIAALRAARVDAAQLQTVLSPVAAYINLGRWVVDCWCGGGCAAHPSWPESRCFDCGRIYTTVIFPAGLDEIVALLVARPLERHRNWTPAEGIETLREENIVHRVGVAEAAL